MYLLTSCLRSTKPRPIFFQYFCARNRFHGLLDYTMTAVSEVQSEYHKNMSLCLAKKIACCPIYVTKCNIAIFFIELIKSI